MAFSQVVCVTLQIVSMGNVLDSCATIMNFSFLKRFLVSVAMLCIVTPLVVADDADINYKPQIHGTFRGRYESELRDGYGRFQVRNARLSARGMVAASIDYFMQMDLSANGKFYFLDAYARIGLGRGWRIKAGQFRMPFGVDIFRLPGDYIFSNRMFIAKQGFNYRQVGAQFIFDTRLGTLPLTLEGGMFNSASTVDHNVWQNKYNFAGKATLNVANVKLGASYASIVPDRVRINAADLFCGYKMGRWELIAEGLMKHYTHRRHKDSWAYAFSSVYVMPVKWGDFNALSFQGRFDGLTDHSSGAGTDTGALTTNDPGRNRVTLGSTLSCFRGPVHADVRLDFEKYFYRDKALNPAGTDDRLLIELIVKF